MPWGFEALSSGTAGTAGPLQVNPLEPPWAQQKWRFEERSVGRSDSPKGVSQGVSARESGHFGTLQGRLEKTRSKGLGAKRIKAAKTRRLDLSNPRG